MMAGVTSPLISVAELAALLDSTDPPPRILDVQFVLGDPYAGRRLYRRAHVPDAIFCDLDTVLAGPVGPTGGRHPLPRTDRLQEQLRRLGVRASRPVVVYDEGAGMAAARAWWVLRWVGHRDVRILDGGLPAWVAAGEPRATGDTPAPARGDFTVNPGGMPLLDADGAARLAHDGLLLDVRAPERYRGESEPIDPVAGHIPGAVNAPVADSLDESGRYRGAEQLRDRFARLGVAPDRSVGAYCGSGLSAAQQVVALTIAGFKPALYAGSWSDWITDPHRPVATGPS
jgi:thiosulfate/3-mercaptopyruvate sulfurtransferase